MLYFVAGYVVLVVIGFVIFAVRERKEDRRRKLNTAAEKIVREDLLLYSLKNPYSDTGRVEIPASKRIMIAVDIKAGGKKQSFVFDPAKQVNIGRGDRNQIIIHDPAVSELHATVHLSNGHVCIYNASSAKKIFVKRGSGRKAVNPGLSVVLKTGDDVLIAGYRLRVKLFIFDINYR